MRTSWLQPGAGSTRATTSNQRQNVYRDVVFLYVLYPYYIFSLCYHRVARQMRACYVDWIIGRLPPPPLCAAAPFLGKNQTYQNCLITSSAAHKQSSAFSNIEAILSIMAKVSLSRQMSRKYMLHIVRCVLARAQTQHIIYLAARSIVCWSDRPTARKAKRKAKSREESGRFLSDSLW